MKRKWLKYERETRLTGFLIVAILLVINTATVFLLYNVRQQYKMQMEEKLHFIAELAGRQWQDAGMSGVQTMPDEIRKIVEEAEVKEIGLIDDAGRLRISTSPYRMYFPADITGRILRYEPSTGRVMPGLGLPYKIGYSSYVTFVYDRKILNANLMIIAPADFLGALEVSEKVLNYSLLVIGFMIFVFLYFYLKNILAPFRKMAQIARDELRNNGVSFESDAELVMDTYQRMINELKEKGRKLGELYDSEKNRADNLENYSRQVLDNIDKGIITLYIDGSPVSFNKAAMEILGEKGIHDIKEMISQNINEENILTEYERNDGKKIFLRAETGDFRGLDGRIIGRNIIVSDITESRKMEELAGYVERAQLIDSAAKNLVSKLTPMIRDLTGRLAKPGMEKALSDGLNEIDKSVKDYGRIFSLQKIEATGIFSPEIIFRSAKMKEVLDLSARVAPSDSTVLISGESGTGKELIAKEIHRLSSRCAGPFIALNCAALPETLLESELFGYVKGAFTGANRDKPGLFQVAEQGSFFLDEVGELSLALQAKILRVIQEREIVPIGGTKPVKIFVRLIAATNQNLEDLVKKGKFRQDLYYRLNVFPIHIPPLRERVDDIEPLTVHLIRKLSSRYNKQVSGISPKALKSIEQSSWPGNIRQLENTIERALVMAENSRIESSDIEFMISENNLNPDERINEGLRAVSSKVVAETESRVIKEVLNQTGGNKSEAARRLKISYRVMLKKIKDYGLD